MDQGLHVGKGETAKSDHRYPDGHLQESSLTCWMFTDFQRHKCRFISSFFRHVSSGCFCRLRLSNPGAHASDKDLTSWNTVKTSKVNYLPSLMRHLRPRRERNLPEAHSRTGSIPDTSVCIPAPTRRCPHNPDHKCHLFAYTVSPKATQLLT